MFKKIISYILVLYIILTNNSTIIFAEPDINSELSEPTTITEAEQNTSNDPSIPTVIAESAVMIDADTGVILYDKDCHRKLYPASITKVMTTLLTLENTKPEDIITHSHNAVFGIGPGSSHIGMREDEQITVEQAVHGIMLASANEVCMAVAEHVDGDVDTFVKRMNDRVAALGCVDTHFNNPHGFHDPEHYTTAYDMALIMQEAIKNKTFVDIISTRTYIIPETNIVNEKRYLSNKAKMIHPTSPHYYEYCVGSKTGFTDEAGNTLVTYGSKDGINLITTVMKDQGTNTYVDTKALLEYGFSLYSEKEVVKKEDFTKDITVTQQYKHKDKKSKQELTNKIEIGAVKAELKDSLSLKLPNTLDVSDITFKADLPDSLNAPVNKGAVIGSYKVIYNSKEISSVDIISANSVAPLEEDILKKKYDEMVKKEFWNKNGTLVKIIIIATIIAIIVGVFAIVYIRNVNLKSRKKRISRRKFKNRF